MGSWLVGLCVLAVDPPELFFDQPKEKPSCLKGIQFLFFKPLKFGAASPYRVIPTPTMCQALFLAVGRMLFSPKGLLGEFNENWYVKAFSFELARGMLSGLEEFFQVCSRVCKQL